LRRRTIYLLVLAALAAGIPMAVAGPAAAADRFSCRASAARVILLGAGPIEPILANDPNDPCLSETRSGTPPQIGGAVGVGAAQAQTVASPTTGTAGARVADVGVNLGPTLLPLNIAVEGINASSSYYCQGTTLSYAGSSQVAAISINGLVIAIPDPSAPVDIDLGDLLTIHLNQTVVASVGDRTEVTRRSVFIESKLLATQVALGEAIAGVAGNPCLTGGGGAPVPGPGTVTTIQVPIPAGSIAGISPGIVPGACATKPFTVTVRGRGIARTVFSVDGKLAAAVGKNNAPTFTLDPVKVAVGLHRVSALVSYLDRNVKPKTLSFVFGRCGLVAPTTAQFGKCANIRITNTRPGKVFVALFSGPKSVRVFGGHLYNFTKPGTRVVCIKIPLRARGASLGTTRRFTVAVKVGGKNFIRTIRVS
jgi:hypothetical protein